jgi:phage terminase small subunit
MTPKQTDFARHYAETQNITQSALAAGYSHAFANTKAKYLLDNPDIVTEIKRLRARLNERADKSATDVVNEYAKVAFLDRTDFMKEDPDNEGAYIYKAPHELTQEQRDIVEKVHTNNVYKDGKLVSQTYRYTLMDKANALQQMGRHFGIFDDKLKLTTDRQNPFKNATPAQLSKLREAFIGTMTDPHLIEGHYEEIKK